MQFSISEEAGNSLRTLHSYNLLEEPTSCTGLGFQSLCSSFQTDDAIIILFYVTRSTYTKASSHHSDWRPAAAPNILGNVLAFHSISFGLLSKIQDKETGKKT